MKAIAAITAIVMLISACADDVPAPAPTAPPEVAAAVTLPSATPQPTATAQPTPSPVPTNTPEPTPTFVPPPVILPTVGVVLETPTPTAKFPVELERRLDAIGLQTALVRGLSEREPVDRRLVSAQELRTIIQDGLLEDQQDLEIAGRLYEMLGIIQPEDSIADILLDVYADIVVGLFDSEENVLFVVADRDEFTPLNELTVSHEITHSLQQLHFDIRGLLDAVENNSDQQRALRALIEGDASLVAYIYRLQFFDEDQEQAARDESQSADLSAYRAAPTVIQRTVAFPYVEGPNFAISLYLQDNSFTPIDQSYQAPPTSTEQIIHPELYGVESPIEITLPDLASVLGAGWTEVQRDVLGELFVSAMLEGGMDPTSAGTAGAGWGGDAYLLLEDPAGNDVLASVSTWDTVQDAAEFVAALREYFRFVTGADWAEGSDGTADAQRLTSDRMVLDLRSDSANVWLSIAADDVTLDSVVTAVRENTNVPAPIGPTATATPTP